MGVALKYLRELSKKVGLELDHKAATSLLILLLLLILLPIGLFLIRKEITFLPQAAGELIQLGDGGCIRLNKDNKKAVDCPTIPLKLINPFFNVNGSPNPSPSASAQSSASPGTSPNPSPNPSATPIGTNTGPVVSIKAFNNDIQAALDNVKDTGGAVYVPAGTYTTAKKIKMYTNTTLFGDGIDQTIIQLDPSALTSDEGLLANDTNYGHENIVVRDLTLKGLGQESGVLQCCVGIKLRQLKNAHFHNIKVEGFSWHGVWMVYKKQTASSNGSDTVKNVRFSNCQIVNNKGSGIALDSPVSENVIDNCTFNGNNSGTGQDNYLKSGGAISLFMDEDGAVAENKILNNTVTGNGFRGISVMARNNITAIAQKLIPDNAICNNIVENNADAGIVDANSEDSFYIANRISDNGGKVQTGPVSYYDHSITSWATTPGNTSTKITDDPNPAATSIECRIPDKLQTIPPAPAKPSANNQPINFALINTAFAQSTSSGILQYRLAESQAGLQQAQWKQFALIPTHINLASDLSKTNNWIPQALAQDSDDLFIDGEDSDSNDQFVSTQSASQSPAASGTASFNIGPQFLNTTFTLSSSNPGAKQIWVEYKHPDGTTRTDNVNFDLVDKTPQILGLACNLDISRENLKITIEGEHFGNAVGTAATISPNKQIEVLGWNDKEITGMLKKPNIPMNEGTRFKIELTRPDGFKSGSAVCAVDKSLISLGARIFCREPGKFDASDVSVTLLYNPQDPASPNKVNKVEEKVTINAAGEIPNLKTVLQTDKNYVFSIKAPNSLRRNAYFTAKEGTTEILRQDGTPFVLPIGDIAPLIQPDGQINSLDRAELIRQWRILGQGEAKLTGDFNRDSRVNSIDWACMSYDFGSADEPLPTSVPQPASASIHIPGSPSPSPSPLPSGASPSPSPSPDTSNSARIDVGGKLFLDTNRNKIPDVGESFITQGSGTVKLLQLPENHVVDTPLTAEELAESKTLSQVNNGLPGASYDISVFVPKDSSNVFAVVGSATNGTLTGTVDFKVDAPLSNSSRVINIPVTSVTQ